MDRFNSSVFELAQKKKFSLIVSNLIPIKHNALFLNFNRQSITDKSSPNLYA